MKKAFSWASWSIATKISVLFLGLSVLSMSVAGYLALTTLRNQGDYTIDIIKSIGAYVTRDSTAHLTNLGEEVVKQKALDVARQIEIYLQYHPPMTATEMRNDRELRAIVVQPIGTTGYTTLIDPYQSLIVIHKYPEQEKSIVPLKHDLPSFWSLVESSMVGNSIAGYYEWQEVDGRISEKFAGIAPVRTRDGRTLTLWATTYIKEFSKPADDTKFEINSTIADQSNFINQKVSNIQDLFVTLFTAILCVVIGLAFLLSWFITNPIKALKRGAEAVGRGNLDHQIDVRGNDELGDLAKSFNTMSRDLKAYMEELNKTAAENLAKERKIQANLRLYVRLIGEAQETERKRIARDLHDETAQALVVVSRQLDELADGNAQVSAEKVREDVQKILDGVRRFSQELRPSILDDLGLIPAVDWLASELTKHHGISVEMAVNGEEKALSKQTELMLFRIVQEALNNVWKHSEATRVTVSFEYSDSTVKVTIRDNGKGFNIPPRVGDLAVAGKLGLTGVQERAQLLGGVLNIKSQPGKGTELSVEVKIRSV